MKQYTVTRPVTITAHRVGMPKQQAFMRSGHLAPVPGETDIYDITNRVDLQPGEVVAIETDDPEILTCLEPEGAEQPDVVTTAVFFDDPTEPEG